LAQRSAHLHQLKTLFELLNKYVDLDRSDGKTKVLFKRRENAVPKGRVCGALRLRQIEDERRTFVAQSTVVIHDEKCRVHDRCRKTGTVGISNMTIVEVQSAGAEDFRGEIELLHPIFDDRPAEKSFGPGVHLVCHLFGRLHEGRITMNSELEVPLII